MSHRLRVYLGTGQVGWLWLDAGRRFAFQYDPQWLANETAIPLSLTLPLRAEPFGDEQARPFFANLLPESDLRRTIARRLGLSEQNDFALLEAVGGECAGAVSLLPEDVTPKTEGRYHPLDDDTLDALIRDLPQRPMLAGEKGFRLSLAGAQDKLPVLFDGERLSLPAGIAPSSHILKPPIAHHPDSVQNEYFCMRLAHRVGLSVPPVTILHARQPLYLVQRYDRQQLPGGRLERVHQEDFCQALGVAPDQKYEKEGGPGLRQCFDLIRDRSIQPLADIKALLQWVIFNYLIGNADAHGKNISLLLTGAGPTLAPFYDLMSTAVYPGLTTRLAMHVGREDRPEWIIGRHWQRFADEAGIDFKLLRQTLLRMQTRVDAEARTLAAQWQAEQGRCEIIERIIGVVEQRGRRLASILGY